MKQMHDLNDSLLMPRVYSALTAALLLYCFDTRQTLAQVTFYDDLSTFESASSTTVGSTFESYPDGFVPSPLVDSSFVYTQGAGPTTLYVAAPGQPGSFQFGLPLESNVLTVNGNEDFDITFLGTPPTAVGFDTYTNEFLPPVVTVYDTTDQLIGTYVLTQAPDTLGFVGMTSTVAIGRVHWLADLGGVVHTGIDNVRTGDALPCEGDANNDGSVDPLDAGYVLARFGCSVDAGDTPCDQADQNKDGQVDPLDAGYVLARFGECV